MRGLVGGGVIGGLRERGTGRGANLAAGVASEDRDRRLFAAIENVDELARQEKPVDGAVGEIARGRRDIWVRVRLVHGAEVLEDRALAIAAASAAPIASGGLFAETGLLQSGGRDHVGALRNRPGEQPARLMARPSGRGR